MSFWWDVHRLHVGDIEDVYFLVVPQVSSISKFEGLRYLSIGT